MAQERGGRGGSTAAAPAAVLKIMGVSSRSVVQSDSEIVSRNGDEMTLCDIQVSAMNT